jgi:hypothetical protein
MLPHNIFVLSGLIQIQKRIQNLLKNGFQKLEKKKKRNFPLLLAFGPAIWQACSLPHPSRPVSPLLSSAGPAARPAHSCLIAP